MVRFCVHAKASAKRIAQIVGGKMQTVEKKYPRNILGVGHTPPKDGEELDEVSRFGIKGNLKQVQETLPLSYRSVNLGAFLLNTIFMS